MASAFSNLAVLEDVNAVSINDGRKPMGYNDRRTILRGLLEGSKNFLTKMVVDSDIFVMFNGKPHFHSERAN